MVLVPSSSTKMVQQPVEISGEVKPSGNCKPSLTMSFWRKIPTSSFFILPIKLPFPPKEVIPNMEFPRDPPPAISLIE